MGGEWWGWAEGDSIIVVWWVLNILVVMEGLEVLVWGLVVMLVVKITYSEKTPGWCCWCWVMGGGRRVVGTNAEFKDCLEATPKALRILRETSNSSLIR